MEYLASVVGQLRASGIKSLATGALVIVEGTYKHCQVVGSDDSIVVVALLMC